MLLSPAASNASLPSSQGFWGRFKTPKSQKDVELPNKQAHMALTRQRLLTLAFNDMETIRMVSTRYPPIPDLECSRVAAAP
ncbi:hypothetical protein AcV7_009045 [Taiwanofungus camphoratus]|nr:hypothetical protein AcV7_009045 [Antrodia cinnamomea]